MTNQKSSETFPPLSFEFLKGIRSTTNIYGRWYAAADIARKMRTQTGAITRKLQEEDIRTMYTPTKKGYRDLVFVSQAALFETVFRSKNPWARESAKEIIRAMDTPGNPSQKDNISAIKADDRSRKTMFEMITENQDEIIKEIEKDEEVADKAALRLRILDTQIEMMEEAIEVLKKTGGFDKLDKAIRSMTRFRESKYCQD